MLLEQNLHTEKNNFIGLKKAKILFIMHYQICNGMFLSVFRDDAQGQQRTGFAEGTTML